MGPSIMEAGTRSRSVMEAGNPFLSLGQLVESLFPPATSLQLGATGTSQLS